MNTNSIAKINQELNELLLQHEALEAAECFWQSSPARKSMYLGMRNKLLDKIITLYLERQLLLAAR